MLGAGAGQGRGRSEIILLLSMLGLLAATPQPPHRGSQVVGKTITLILMSAASGGHGAVPSVQ